MNRLLRRLRQALAVERRFAADAAHELRAPLAAAIAQAEVLAGTLDDAAGISRATRLVGSMRRLGRLVEKLLQLARAEAGLALSRQPVDLGTIVKLIVDDAQRAPGVGPRLRLVAPAPGTAVVRTDLDALGIAVQNLIDNAVHHGDPDQPIVVTVTPSRNAGEAGEVSGPTLSVRNGAPVMPSYQLAELKARFVRGPTEAAGSGLGLAIVDDISRQIGARLDLYSPARGDPVGFEAVVEFP